MNINAGSLLTGYEVRVSLQLLSMSRGCYVSGRPGGRKRARKEVTVRVGETDAARVGKGRNW